MTFARLSERTRGWLPFATASVAAALALRRLDDFDTWWHLASGRWIVSHRAVPATDTLSFTVPDHPWINVQWLFDVVLYLLHAVGGPSLLVIVSAAAFTAAVWVMLKNLRLWLGEVPASALCLWAILIAEERFIIRPEMASFFLFQAVLWILMTARRNEGRTLWLLVPVMLLWVNCHSLFIIGLYCIGCTVAGALAARLPFLPAGWRSASALGPTATRRLLVSSGAAAAVTLLNPYLLDGLLFPFKLMSRFDTSNAAFQSIGEFRRPFSGYLTTLSVGAYQILFFFGLGVVVVAAVVGLRKGRKEEAANGQPKAGFDLAWAAIFAGLAYLSVLARRNTALFAIGAAPILGAYLSLIGAKLTTGGKQVFERLAAVASPFLLLGCFAFIGVVATNTYTHWTGFTREFGLGTLTVNFPIRAVAFAREAGLPPRMYNDLTAGGYLTWEPAVEGGVFIDGRLEVYDTEFLTRYTLGLSNGTVWRQQADAYGINTVLLFHRWENRHGLIRLLVSDPAWSLVYHDEVAVLFVRHRGNEASVARAQSMFPRWSRETSASLRAPTAKWQYPVSRVTAMSAYAALLTSIGREEAGIELFEALLSYRPPAQKERVARIHVGLHLAKKGELEEALVHLERAAAIGPPNRALQDAIRKIRDWSPAP